MAITTLDGYIAAAKQKIVLTKTSGMTTVAANFGETLHLAGNPGAGTLAGSNTANGVVPTDATPGFPLINAFGASATGYLTGVDFSSTVACRMKLVDVLFKAGAYPYNTNTTLSSQPSYSSRVPGGTNFGGLELWVEAVTAFTGNLSIAVTYTNQDGTAARTTGTVTTNAAPIMGRMIQLPLQARDCGIQKIESVVATVSTVGTFNLLVVRPLWEGNIRLANAGDIHDFMKTGMPQVFADSALGLFIAADSISTGIPSLLLEVANG